MEVHRYPRKHCIEGISGGSAALESSRSPVYPPKASWHFSQKISPAVDGYSAWVKTDPETILMRHVVDARGFYPAFCEAPARRHEPSSQEYRFYDDVPNRLTEQRRLSVYNWNPGPRRGKEGAIERHIAGNGTSSPCRKQLNTSSTIS